jgi:hypothetical protein
VRTPDDLSTILGVRRLSAPVPDKRLPNKKRAGERGETYCFRQYLMTLAANGLLRFPLSVPVTKEHYQNPDYLVYCGDLSLIGVEIAEVTGRGKDARPCDIVGGDMDAPDLDAAERRWVEAVARTVAKKLSHLSRNDVVHARSYDVLIHTNTAWDGQIDFRSACETLRRTMPAPNTIFRRGVRHPVRVHVLGSGLLFFDAFGACRFLACVERSEQH